MDKRVAALLAAVCVTSTAFGQVRDQHSVDGVVAALGAPLSAEAVVQARQYDDQLLSQGRDDTRRVYLVTDERSRRVNDLVRKLLTAMGQDPKAWAVRVLDTNPQTNNAFVVGGEYVYVFTGFLAAAQSDDELAFVLGHELGHSLLKHNERRRNDSAMQLSQIAALIAALSKGKTAQEVGQFGEVFGAQYSQKDEAEADALGAAIALRAGFDPLRGADFFTRMVKENDAAAPGATLTEAQLQSMRLQATQAQNTCAQWMTAWNAGQMARTPPNAEKINRICADAETARVSFNKANAEFYGAQTQASLQKLTSSHPNNQARVAALAATVDFLGGRRDLASLSKYETAYIVMQALDTTHSVLLHAADVTSAPPLVQTDKLMPQDGVTARLEKLKGAFDAGLITRDEYDAKRKAVLTEL